MTQGDGRKAQPRKRASDEGYNSYMLFLLSTTSGLWPCVPHVRSKHALQVYSLRGCVLMNTDFNMNQTHPLLWCCLERSSQQHTFVLSTGPVLSCPSCQGVSSSLFMPSQAHMVCEHVCICIFLKGPGYTREGFYLRHSASRYMPRRASRTTN